MAQIGSLSVKLGLVTAQWTQDTAKARQDAKTLQKAFDELGGSLKTLQGHLKTLGGGLGVAAKRLVKSSRYPPIFGPGIPSEGPISFLMFPLLSIAPAPP